MFKKVKAKVGKRVDDVAKRAEKAAQEARQIAERKAREAQRAAQEARAKLEREARKKAAQLEREAKERAERLKGTAELAGAEVAERARKAVEKMEQGVEHVAHKGVDGAKATFRRLDVQTWPTNAEPFVFPETSDGQLQRRQNIGLAISGGGTRSMSLSLGYMRALNEQGVLDRARYIGAISGGSWIAVPYSYLPPEISDVAFFGEDVPPERLTPATLSRLSQRDGILAKRIGASELLFPILSGLVINKLARSLHLPRVPIAGISFGLDDGDEEWGRALGGIFLEPFGINGDRYASWRASDAARIIDRNSNLIGKDKLSMSDFVIQRQDRPYLCVNGAMNQDAYLIPDDPGEKWRPLGWRSWEHYEFTPKYSGIHRHSRGIAKVNVGGGYLENIGIDTVFPIPKGPFVNVSSGLDHHRFSPQDMMAISGAAPAYLMHGIMRLVPDIPVLRDRGLGALINIMPKLRDWPVQFAGKPLVRERCFGDGGYVDNYGIIPLLKRKVEKIIVLLNTDIPLGRHETTVMGKNPECDTYLYALFGANTGRSMSGDSPADFLQPGRFLGRENGQVFDTSGLRGLLKGMIDNRQAGRPTFHRGRYTTLRNDFFGIEAGHECEILWIYNDLYASWFDRLPLETKDLFKGGSRERLGLATFPHIKTFANKSDSETSGHDLHVIDAFRRGGLRGAIDHLDRIVDLDSFQVKLAASHAYHVANDLKNEIASLTGR